MYDIISLNILVYWMTLMLFSNVESFLYYYNKPNFVRIIILYTVLSWVFTLIFRNKLSLTVWVSRFNFQCHTHPSFSVLCDIAFICNLLFSLICLFCGRICMEKQELANGHCIMETWHFCLIIKPVHAY